MRKILIPFILILSLITLSACSAYKIDIQQGNSLKQEELDSLKVGMTRKQVVFVIGTPLIKDPFHTDRWDYVYTIQPGGKKMKKHHLSLFFDNDTLVRIDDSKLNKELILKE